MARGSQRRGIGLIQRSYCLTLMRAGSRANAKIIRCCTADTMNRTTAITRRWRRKAWYQRPCARLGDDAAPPPWKNDSSMKLMSGLTYLHRNSPGRYAAPISARSSGQRGVLPTTAYGAGTVPVAQFASERAWRMGLTNCGLADGDVHAAASHGPDSLRRRWTVRDAVKAALHRAGIGHSGHRVKPLAPSWIWTAIVLLSLLLGC